MSTTDTNKPMKMAERQAKRAELDTAKKWISRLITRQQKLTSTGDPEIQTLVNDALDVNKQVPHRILTQARAMGQTHCRGFEMWSVDLPFNVPERATSRVYLHEYLRGVLEAAQERVDALELELATHGHVPADDKPDIVP